MPSIEPHPHQSIDVAQMEIDAQATVGLRDNPPVGFERAKAPRGGPIDNATQSEDAGG